MSTNKICYLISKNDKRLVFNTVGKSEISFNVEIADMLSSTRTSAGISQVELSKRTGIDQSDIFKLERGIGNPSINTLNRLASALNKKLVISLNDKEKRS